MVMSGGLGTPATLAEGGNGLLDLGGEEMEYHV